jgi:anti-sigma B factor antagonist
LTFGAGELQLNDEIRRAVAGRRIHLVIDLEGVEKIDSAGLGTLLYARVELRRVGGRLALARLHAAHRKSFLTAGLESAFEIFDDDQDAIHSLSRMGKTSEFDSTLMMPLSQAMGSDARL